MRGVLEPIALATVSLVRGKEYWRVTSAELLERIPARAEIVRPLALLDKLVQGEAVHPELFEAVEGGLNELGAHAIKEKGSEEKFVAHVLFHLGYLKETDLKLDKKDLIKAINDGLQDSHLT